MIKYLLILSFLAFGFNSNAQKMTREQYVSTYYLLAIEQMNLYKVPASITLAQGLLETESGNSDLAKIAKNHFGIKCKTEWTGMKFIKDDDKKNECFRAYATVEESYKDHSMILRNRPWYAPLFNLDMKDYKSWAYGLKAGGYATNPAYPQMLIRLIEDLKLYEFDNYGKIPQKIEIKIDTVALKEEKRIADSIQAYKETIQIPAYQRANNLRFTIIDSNFNLTALATKYKISSRLLIMYNEMENEQLIQKGQNFFLEPKKDYNSLGFHETLPGQSLYDISQIYGIKLAALRKYNKLEGWEQPIVGEVINLNSTRNGKMKTRPYFELQLEREAIANEEVRRNKEKEIKNTEDQYLRNSQQTITRLPNSDKSVIIHIVKAQENLFRISKIYNVKPIEILEWNNLTMEEGLKLGQSLKILTNAQIIAPNPELPKAPAPKKIGFKIEN